ncbi:hypothetical protein Sste5346_000871 [Sporothrix stenoceras]|uniref:Uncharacterized protein n=1 Tax=Sporothrix stenoceras TaxID=5173 RepID=A0ABR3ZU97_9PEZI
MLGHSAESSPEELLDVFKAAALSVTKLYKTSAAVQSKARIEGYQDCLEDLLTLLEKNDVDVRTIRRWVVERLDGREPILPTIESEDEIEKTDGSTPEPQPAASNSHQKQIRGADAAVSNTKNSNINSSAANINSDTAMQTEADAEAEADMETETETPSPSKNSRIAATSTMAAPVSTKKTKAKARNAAASSSTSTSTATPTDSSSDNIDHADASGPNADHFTFRSSVPYPTNESYLELANLDLSDRRSASGSVKDASEPPSATATSTSTNGSTYVFNAPTNASQTDNNTSSSPSHTSGSRQFRVRHATGRPNGRSALSARYSRSSAGQKRKLNFDEIFDVASLGYGKDVFGRGGPKRSRQA